MDIVSPPVLRDKECSFIDNLITITCIYPRWRRLVGTVLLSTHIFVLLLSSEETILRNDIVSINKLLSKRSPSEITTGLVWGANTRILAIKMPRMSSRIRIQEQINLFQQDPALNRNWTPLSDA